jgi:hypothetical protein
MIKEQRMKIAGAYAEQLVRNADWIKKCEYLSKNQLVNERSMEEPSH